MIRQYHNKPLRLTWYRAGRPAPGARPASFCGFVIEFITQALAHITLIFFLSLPLLCFSNLTRAEAVNLIDSNIERSHQVNNMAYGELLFHYYQHQALNGITHILVKNQHGGYQEHQDHADILQGALYLSLGMTEHAETIFTATATNSLNPETRNKAWIALAELAYGQKNYQKAKTILINNIEALGASDNYKQQKNQVHEYLGLIFLREGQYQNAIEQLAAINHDPLKQRYASYNLALAFFALKENDNALILLQSLLKLPTYNAEEDAIRDKAALALGQHYLEQNKPYLSKQAFSEVRLSSAFANEALLGLGWANLSRAELSTALAPWLELLKRDHAQKTVQEAFLMTPRAYEQLNAFQDAFSSYIIASRVYEAEIDHIKTTLSYINQNNWLEQLKPENTQAAPGNDFLFKQGTESVPLNGPEAAYLYQLFSTNNFNKGFQQFLELQELEHHLTNWKTKLPVFNLMVENQVFKNNALISQLNNKINSIDIDKFSDQVAELSNETNMYTEQENFFLLANDKEQSILNSFKKLEAIIDRLPNTEEFSTIRSRYRIIRGTFFWNLKYNSYRASYAFKNELQKTREELNKLDLNIKNLQRSKDIATNRHSIHKKRINSLELKIENLIGRIQTHKISQQAELQSMANTLLNARLTHTSNLLAQTQIAIARLQDKAASGERRIP